MHITYSVPFFLVSFFGESYVQLNVPASSSTTSLKFCFLTSRPDGLLFLAAGNEAYFSVELHSGNIHVRLKIMAIVLILNQAN